MNKKVQELNIIKNKNHNQYLLKLKRVLGKQEMMAIGKMFLSRAKSVAINLKFWKVMQFKKLILKIKIVLEIQDKPEIIEYSQKSIF